MECVDVDALDLEVAIVEEALLFFIPVVIIKASFTCVNNKGEEDVFRVLKRVLNRETSIY